MEELLYKYLSELNQKGFNIFELLTFGDSVFFQDNSNEPLPKNEFSKKYFCEKYYMIDKDTFNNWLKIWCPEIEISKEKRKLSEIEVDIILERLGKVNQSNFNSYNKKELIELLFEGENIKKSCKYEKLNWILDNLNLKMNHEKINCFPPIISNQVIQSHFAGNREKLDEIERLGRLREPKIAVLEKTFKKAIKMTEKERSDWTRVTTRRFLFYILKDMETDPQYSHLFKK